MVLAFVGLKMIAEWWIPHEEGEPLVSPVASLLVIAVLLGISIAASLVASYREGPADETTGDIE